MTGYPDLNFPAFVDMAKRMRAAGHEVVNPTELPHNDEEGEQAWEWYLRHDLRAMLDCDSILMLPGWQDSRGAQFERAVAKKLKMTVYYPRDYTGLGI